MTAKHTHRFDKPWRGSRHCKTCRLRQFQVASGEWRDSMTLRAFAERWLPVVSGTKPQDMLTIKVAYPFEWNCYETWKVVFRVRFDFTDVLGRTAAGLGTRTDVMNGWQSKYEEDFCRIDHAAENYYRDRTGRNYDIGDNAYGAMRELIQSPIGVPQPASPPSLVVVPPEDAPA